MKKFCSQCDKETKVFDFNNTCDECGKPYPKMRGGIGNFQNDPKRAAEVGRKGGKAGSRISAAK